MEGRGDSRDTVQMTKSRTGKDEKAARNKANRFPQATYQQELLRLQGELVQMQE